MLKLYWANFTTAQLHHLTRKYPDFLSENVFHQHDMIKRWLTERNSERLWNKYERFKELKLMDIIKEMKKKDSFIQFALTTTTKIPATTTTILTTTTTTNSNDKQ